MLTENKIRRVLTTDEFLQAIHGYEDNPFLTFREKKICRLYQTYGHSRKLRGILMREMNITSRTLGQYRYLILEKMGIRTSLRQWKGYEKYFENLDQKVIEYAAMKLKKEWRDNHDRIG